MDQRIQAAFIAGTERISAWADLLDAINVFPVADSDTGRNLLVSLSPLRIIAGRDPDEVADALLRAASGNSGNIAVHFLCRLLHMRHADELPQAVREGYEAAKASVAHPEPGTMLSVFEALADRLENTRSETVSMCRVIEHLAETVRQGPDCLPVLKEAGVVDAGALGMFIFLEGFLGSLSGETGTFPPVTERFRGWLEAHPPGEPADTGGHCINALVQLRQDADDASRQVAEWGESVVTSTHQGCMKIHLHSTTSDSIREKISSLGHIIQWEDGALAAAGIVSGKAAGPVHIMTDGAGSVTREDARHLGITLLDSIVVMGEQAIPETRLSPEALYAAMKQGVRVSTSQASVFERHQHYQSVLSRYEQVLYLCVGSVYTGNYDTVMAWKAAHDPENRLRVIDTGTASGRLGALVLAAAGHARRSETIEEVIRFADEALSACEEYIFIDRLNYLAAGGRLSKTGAFFGDLLRLKPVISPLAEGARKVGVVRDTKEQLAFFRKKLEQIVSERETGFIMLEYSDNREWVETHVLPLARKLAPAFETVLRPLSLTSGAHMGPGTWASVFLKKAVPAPGDKKLF